MTKDEENYEEAVKAVNSSFGGGKPSSDLMKIFDDECCNNLTKNVSTPVNIRLRSSIMLMFFLE